MTPANTAPSLKWTQLDNPSDQEASRLLLEFVRALARADARRDAAEDRACR